MQNKEYTISQLIRNQSFRRMADGTASAEEISKWNHWMEESDQNREKARKAIAEVAGFEFSDPDYPDLEAEWNQLYYLTAGKSESGNRPSSKSSSLTWIYRVASILILGGLVGMGSYLSVLQPESGDTAAQLEQITRQQTITTGSDEEKTIRFSNGSRVVLNSNSRMSYTIGILHEQIIEVTLEGEAYFDAEGDPDKAHPVFAVHTADGIIRDIGTEFLVSVQNDRSRVVLLDGIVEVDIKNHVSSNGDIVMQKGEMLEFDTMNVLSKKLVNASFYTSWATGSMVFDGTTIQEIAEFIDWRFDVETHIRNPELAEVKIDGSIHFKSLEEFLRSLSVVIKVPVYQSEDRKTIYIDGNDAGQDHISR